MSSPLPPFLHVALIHDLPPSSPHTASALSTLLSTLHALSQTTTLIPGLHSLVTQLACPTRIYRQWDLVLNICEGKNGLAREAQVPALLEAYEIPFCFADAATTALALDKGRTKMVLGWWGVPTAGFALVGKEDDLDDLFPEGRVNGALREVGPRCSSCGEAHKEDWGYPIFAKPAGEGTSKGILAISKIHEPKELAPTIQTLRSLYGEQDILIEPFLAGREITVGILGTGAKSRVIGANEYVYRKKKEDRAGDKVTETLENGSNPRNETENIIDFASDEVKNGPMGPDAPLQVVSLDLESDEQAKRAAEVALRAWRALGCRDPGRIDLRYADSGETPSVLEVNPIPGIIEGWSDLALIAASNGMTYQNFIGEIIESAWKRPSSKRTDERNRICCEDENEQDYRKKVNSVIKDEGIADKDSERDVRWEKYNLRT